MQSKFLKMPRDGMIGDGVHINFAINAQNDIVWAYIGTVQTGPMLQYAQPGNRYNGFEDVDFIYGAWTPIYSRGNFGRNYACGGNWSGHAKSLYPRIADGDTPQDKKFELLAIPGAEIIVLPDGVTGGDILATEIDCSMGWAIYFPTAKKAMQQRLSVAEISGAALPVITKKHFLKNETKTVLANVMDVVDTYKL
jgi:hypothetical protein